MNTDELKKLISKKTKLSTALGDFSLGKQLGQGGTAIVRAATLDGAQTKYAIKFLITDISMRVPTAYKRFKQAYVNIASIQHLGCIIPMVLFGETKLDKNVHVPYLIMKAAKGDLKHLIKNKTPDLKAFEKIFSCLLEAISTIHKHGIIHRDIKPENIFVCDEKLVLGDFDIAKFDDSQNFNLVKTKTNSRVGNYLFSAPEQANSKNGKISPAADLYAFAQVMVWLRLGQTIRGLSRIDISNGEDGFEKYNRLFEKLLQQDPSDRLQSADEVVSFLAEHDKYRALMSDRQKHLKALDVFEDIIRKYTCRTPFSKPALVNVNDKDNVNDILNFLMRHQTELDLYAVYDNKDFDIGSIVHLSDARWLLANDEVSVDSIYVYRHFSSGGHLLALKTASLAPIDENSSSSDDYEEVAILGNDYISRAEYDNGWAFINGEYVEVQGKAELRGRYLKPQLLFIAPRVSPLIERESFELVSEISNRFLRDNSLNESALFASLKKIRRAESIRRYD